MGLVDVFNAEDRVQVTKSELFDFMLSKAQTKLLLNGLKNGVSAEDVLKVVGIKQEDKKDERLFMGFYKWSLCL